MTARPHRRADTAPPNRPPSCAARRASPLPRARSLPTQPRALPMPLARRAATVVCARRLLRPSQRRSAACVFVSRVRLLLTKRLANRRRTARRCSVRSIAHQAARTALPGRPLRADSRTGSLCPYCHRSRRETTAVTAPGAGPWRRVHPAAVVRTDQAVPELLAGRERAPLRDLPVRTPVRPLRTAYVVAQMRASRDTRSGSPDAAAYALLLGLESASVALPVEAIGQHARCRRLTSRCSNARTGDRASNPYRRSNVTKRGSQRETDAPRRGSPIRRPRRSGVRAGRRPDRW